MSIMGRLIMVLKTAQRNSMLNVCIFPKCWIFSPFCSSKFPRTMTKCDSFHLNTYYICQEKKHSNENLLYFSSKTYNYILCHQQHYPNLKRQWYSGGVEEFEWNPPKIKLKFRFLIQSFFLLAVNGNAAFSTNI